MHDFKLCDHFIRRKESIKMWQVSFLHALWIEEIYLNLAMNGVRSIDIKLLTEIGPVKHQFNIHVIYANISGRFQSITNCRLDHRWQGEKFSETWTLGAWSEFGNVSKCFMSCIMCAAAHEKFSSQAGMSEAHLKPWIFQKILLDFRDPKKEP